MKERVGRGIVGVVTRLPYVGRSDEIAHDGEACLKRLASLRLFLDVLSLDLIDVASTEDLYRNDEMVCPAPAKEK